MKNKILIFLMLFCFKNVKAQNVEILNLLLKNTKQDTAKVRILDEILDICDVQDILKYAEESNAITDKNLATLKDDAQKKYFLNYKAKALNGLGLYANMKSDYNKALEHFENSIAIFEKIGAKKEMASIINSLGATYYAKGDIKNALDKYVQSLAISETTNDKKVIASTLGNIGMIYFQQGKVDDALINLEKSLKINEEIGNKIEIATMLNNLSAVYKSKGNINKTIDCIEKSLKIHTEIGNKVGISNSLNNLGFMSYSQGAIAKALDYYYKSLKIKEELGDKKGISTAFNNIAGVNLDLGDTTKAIENYKNSLKIKEEIGDKKGEATVLNNLGSIYTNKNESKIALEYLEKGLKLYELVNEKSGIAVALGNIGTVYFKQKNIKKGLEYKQKSLDIYEAIGDKQGIAVTLNRIAKSLIENGTPGEALNYANRSLQLSKAMGFPQDVKDAATALKQIYTSQNKPKEALEMYKLELQMADSTKNRATAKASLENEYQYDYDKKRFADSIVNAKDKLITAAQISKQRNQKLAFASLALLALGGIGFTFYHYKQKKKINEKINTQNNTLKKLNVELIESEENLVKSNNSKEQLINMMSHDLLNPITAITNYNQQVLNRTNNTEELTEAFKTVDAAIQPMHSLLDNMLQWTAIQKDGITAKLKMQDVNEIVKEIISIYKPQAKLKNIKIQDVLQNDFMLETDKSIVSLILRNLLNNAIKYSANDTSIKVTTQNNTTTIEDQGYGITDEMIGYLNNKQLDKIEAKGSGLGLKLCYEFAEAVDAKIIFAKNEKGTTVNILLT